MFYIVNAQQQGSITSGSVVAALDFSVACALHIWINKRKTDELLEVLANSKWFPKFKLVYSTNERISWSSSHIKKSVFVWLKLGLGTVKSNRIWDHSSFGSEKFRRGYLTLASYRTASNRCFVNILLNNCFPLLSHIN